jgi:hypothetical protein
MWRDVSDSIVTVLLAIGSSTIVSTIVANAIQARRERSKARWEMKRAVCVKTLDLVDAVFANTDWQGSDMSHRTLPQERPSIVDLRRGLNELAVTCENPDVIRNYKRCLGLDSVPLSADALVDLRAAVRRELRFGESVDADRETAFFAWIQQSKEAVSRPPSGH